MLRRVLPFLASSLVALASPLSAPLVAQVTYTAMEYTAPNDETFDASAIGVTFRWVIRTKEIRTDER